MHFEAITQLPTAWTMASGRFGVHLFEGALTVDDMVGMQRRGDVAPIDARRRSAAFEVKR